MQTVSFCYCLVSLAPYELGLSRKVLKGQLVDAGVHIVVLDQPMTHGVLTGSEENTMMAKVLTEFMIDLAAAMARDDYATKTSSTGYCESKSAR